MRLVVFFVACTFASVFSPALPSEYRGDGAKAALLAIFFNYSKE